MPYPTDEDIRAIMVRRIKRFSKLTGVALTGIGKGALNDPAFVDQIMRGRGFHLRTYQKMMSWLDRNWPKPDGDPKRTNGARRRVSA